MNRTIASLSVSCAVLALACAAAPTPSPASAPAASPAAALLDGTSFEVTLAFSGEAPLKDTLTFDRGHFESSACTGLGFPKWTQYRAERTGDAVAFEVEAHNPKGPVVEWSGTVQGAVASGKAKRTIDGKTDVGSFQGSAR